MNPIHDAAGNLIAVEIHQTRYSADALARMTATCERYRVALERIAAQEVYDVFAFAGGILEGKGVHEALEADTAATLDPVPPMVAESLLRVDARREVVRAALRWVRGHVAVECQDCQAMIDAVAAFRAVGGTEEEG